MLKDVVMKDNPVAYWPLDTDTRDLCGGPSLNTIAAADVNQIPITVGGRSFYFNEGDRYSHANNSIMMTGQENVSFSLEFWFRADGVPTANRKIYGKAGWGAFVLTTTGITFHMQDTEAAKEIDYAITDWTIPYHVVVTYGTRVVNMFVNGKYVGSFNIVGSILSTVSTFYIGHTSTTLVATSLYMSDIAWYRYQLSEGKIIAHYLAGSVTPLQTDLMESDGAITYDFTDESAQPFMRITDDIEMTGHSVRIIGPYSIDAAGVIDGSIIRWEGPSPGVSVDVSANGTNNWVACTNNRTIPGYEEGVDTGLKTIYFRITVTVNPDNKIYKGLEAVIYTSKNPKASLNGMVATGIEPYRLASHEKSIISNQSNTGISLREGKLIIPAPPTGVAYKSIEMWVRLVEPWRNSAFLFDTRTSSTSPGAYIYVNSTGAMGRAGISKYYVNGVDKALYISDFPVGRWTHLVLDFTEDVTTPINIATNYVGGASATQPWDFGSIALYTTTISSSTVREHYSLAYGRPTMRVVEQTAQVRELPGSAYKYAWSTEMGA